MINSKNLNEINHLAELLDEYKKLKRKTYSVITENLGYIVYVKIKEVINSKFNNKPLDVIIKDRLKEHGVEL